MKTKREICYLFPSFSLRLHGPPTVRSLTIWCILHTKPESTCGNSKLWSAHWETKLDFQRTGLILWVLFTRFLSSHFSKTFKVLFEALRSKFTCQTGQNMGFNWAKGAPRWKPHLVVFFFKPLNDKKTHHSIFSKHSFMIKFAWILTQLTLHKDPPT